MKKSRLASVALLATVFASSCNPGTYAIFTARRSPEADVFLPRCKVEYDQKRKALREDDLAEVVSHHADLERGIATFHEDSGTALEPSSRDAKLSLLCRPNTLWMVQRPLVAARARVDQALAGTGWAKLLACRPRHRIVKRGTDLAVEEGT